MPLDKSECLVKLTFKSIFFHLLGLQLTSMNLNIMNARHNTNVCIQRLKWKALFSLALITLRLAQFPSVPGPHNAGALLVSLRSKSQRWCSFVWCYSLTLPLSPSLEVMEIFRDHKQQWANNRALLMGWKLFMFKPNTDLSPKQIEFYIFEFTVKLTFTNRKNTYRCPDIGTCPPGISPVIHKSHKTLQTTCTAIFLYMSSKRRKILIMR